VESVAVYAAGSGPPGSGWGGWGWAAAAAGGNSPLKEDFRIRDEICSFRPAWRPPLPVL